MWRFIGFRFPGLGLRVWGLRDFIKFSDRVLLIATPLSPEALNRLNPKPETLTGPKRSTKVQVLPGQRRRPRTWPRRERRGSGAAWARP